MAGVCLPLHPMEHQYVVTDEIPAVYSHETEHPHVINPACESYLRQAARGLCIGFIEQPCHPWAADGTPWKFGNELLPDDLDRIEASIEFNCRRLPVLEKDCFKSVIHGAFTLAPDGNPLDGPRAAPAQLPVLLRGDGWLFARRRCGMRETPPGCAPSGCAPRDARDDVAAARPVLRRAAARRHPGYTLGETGVDRLIAWSRTIDFLGREAAEAERANGAVRRLVAFEVDAQDADVNGDEPVWIGDKVCRFCT